MILQRSIFWVNHRSSTNNCAWPFGILYLGVGMCGCQSLLLRLLSSSRECGGFINRYAIIFIIMLQLSHYTSTAVDIILTIILAIHFVTIFSTGTIIINASFITLYHYRIYIFPSTLIQHQHFHMHRHFTCTVVWYQASTINLAQRTSRNISAPPAQSFIHHPNHLLIHMY